jgi:hypothetical protein
MLQSKTKPTQHDPEREKNSMNAHIASLMASLENGCNGRDLTFLHATTGGVSSLLPDDFNERWSICKRRWVLEGRIGCEIGQRAVFPLRIELRLGCRRKLSTSDRILGYSVGFSKPSAEPSASLPT